MSVELKTCLWYDTDAEEAANFYVSLLPGSRITAIRRYTRSGPMAEGTVLVVDFELAGRPFMALNGGPHTTFNDSHSVMVTVDTQEEVDRLWDGLMAGGGEPIACGWLKDRYGLRWQIVPARFMELIGDPDPEKADRTMAAMMGMVKLDIAALEAAARGE
ncbi:MAG: VOC family protein [Rhodobiaceae bacterium]|nr:VOC family protein [Rhodobiaceae bacterium]